MCLKQNACLNFSSGASSVISNTVIWTVMIVSFFTITVTVDLKKKHRLTFEVLEARSIFAVVLTLTQIQHDSEPNNPVWKSQDRWRKVESNWRNRKVWKWPTAILASQSFCLDHVSEEVGAPSTLGDSPKKSLKLFTSPVSFILQKSSWLIYRSVTPWISSKLYWQYNFFNYLLWILSK